MMISKNLRVFVASGAVRARIHIELMIAVINHAAAVRFLELERFEEGKMFLSMPEAARTVDIGRREARRGVCDLIEFDVIAEKSWRRTMS